MTADDSGAASVRASLSGALANAPARLASRFSIVGTTHRAYWRWRLALGPPHGTATVGGTTARFVVSTWSERKRVRDFGGEQFVLARLLEDLTGSETVWDVGACVGTYACFAVQRLPLGRVVAFEPETTNRARLRENLRLNATADRWTVSAAALADHDGTATLASEFVEAGGGHHHLVDDGVTGDGGSATDDEDVAAEYDATAAVGSAVTVRRGESLVAEGIPAPDVLKLDVQGAELQVLRGMGEALDDVDTIYAELHTEKTKWYGATAEAVETFLREAGYSIEHLGEPTARRGGVYFVRARR